MEIRVKRGSLLDDKAEVILLEHFEGDRHFAEEAKQADSSLGGVMERVLQRGEFTGKLFQHSLFHVKEEIPAKKVLLIGLGKRKEWSLERTRQVMGKTAVYLRGLGVKGFSTRLLGRSLNEFEPVAVAQAIVEGIILGLYQFNAYRTEQREDACQIREVTLLEEDRWRGVQTGIRRGEVISEATNFVRDLANHPSNVVTPTRLAEEARSIAKTLGLRCKVLDRKQMEKIGMGAVLGVSRGSLEPPQFIILEYGRARKGKRPIVLVGKSITFDSGGISLKPSEKMEQMKNDMSGGAAVLGVLKAIAQLELPLHVVGLLPATENMPSGTAIKPGDVLKSLSGKTIEVINTDAEGRLCLADALTYGARYKPDAVIDIATLTGACVVALGSYAIGAMSRNPELMESIKKAGERSGERVWELPLWEEYNEQIKSDIADLKNVGGRGAGSITAGLFLHKFVGDYPWVHLDIAGTAWNETDRPYCPKGATGVGVRLLVEYLSDVAGETR